MKVVVVGGGASGMIAAITSAKQGNETILVEKTSSLGNKIKITGKGRCNVTFDGKLITGTGFIYKKKNENNTYFKGQ